ncbi:MAG: hypothetical protein KME30_21520 [Iphinoe sp. HA4291-MV1]|jgi:hypothetical protein|nr:hypothetical protein [Iphinoe sp. HA4291-MV1]
MCKFILFCSAQKSALSRLWGCPARFGYKVGSNPRLPLPFFCMHWDAPVQLSHLPQTSLIAIGQAMVQEQLMVTQNTLTLVLLALYVHYRESVFNNISNAVG